MSFSRSRDAFLKLLKATQFEVEKLEEALKFLNEGEKTVDDDDDDDEDRSNLNLDPNFDRHRDLEKQIINLLLEYLT